MPYLPLIDTRLGTYNSHAYSNGNCLPLTSYPWGMNAFCLQTTDQNGAWFFNPYEPVYQGIRLTHQPSPWLGDFATLLVTPITGSLKQASLFHRQSSYQLDSAIFRPDLLEITSNRFHIKSQVTPTCYGAVMRCHALKKTALSLVFYLPQEARLHQIDKHHIGIELANSDDSSKEAIRFYTAIAFTEPIIAMNQLINDRQIIGQSFKGDGIHIRIDFDKSVVESRLATSYISLEQARCHAQKLTTFDDTLSSTQEAWEKLLGRVSLSTEQPKQAKLFYHCLYRTLVFPQTFHEINEQGDIVHFDCHSKTVKQGRYYTNNGYWDTFRTTYPLYSILYPDYLPHFLEGILNHYHDTGFLPKWLSPDERGIMPGTLVDGVIADAALKGIGSKLMIPLMTAMIDSAKKEDPSLRYGRHGSAVYDKLGYLPLDFNESVSHSLDYAYSDWCIGQVARSLQLNDLANSFEHKSLSYRHLFDQKSGYIRAKNREGTFRDDFNPYAWGRDYAECSAIQASLGALHDIDGLIELMGGRDAFTAYLIRLIDDTTDFECSHYGYEIHEMSEMAQAKLGQLAISNQPSFHIPYLFQLSHQPEQTRVIVETIRDNYFNLEWKAFPGDEDNGSLSAWYIFACLGFYPLCPGKPEYVFGYPAFKQIQLHLKDHTFFIKQEENHDKAILLDGKPITKLNHTQLFTNQTLTF